MPAHAKLDNWNAEITIDSDKSTEWLNSFEYSETVDRNDFFVLAKITGVEVKADGSFIDCAVTARDIGTSIVCSNIKARNITYRFRALGLVSDLQGLNKFEYRFSILQLVDNFTVKVKLPPGAGLVERARLEGTGFRPFEPEWGKPDSDGRVIFVAWKQSQPLLASGTDIKVIYENVTENQWLPLGIIAVLTVALLAFLFIMRRKPMKDILPILTDSERKVVEILLREKKPVDQRTIVKETDFSKPKVSRVISDLETRGLIIRSRKGRTNVIAIAENVRAPQRVPTEKKDITKV